MFHEVMISLKFKENILSQQIKTKKKRVPGNVPTECKARFINKYKIYGSCGWKKSELIFSFIQCVLRISYKKGKEFWVCATKKKLFYFSTTGPFEK